MNSNIREMHDTIREIPLHQVILRNEGDNGEYMLTRTFIYLHIYSLISTHVQEPWYTDMIMFIFSKWCDRPHMHSTTTSINRHISLLNRGHSFLPLIHSHRCFHTSVLHTVLTPERCINRVTKDRKYAPCFSKLLAGSVPNKKKKKKERATV